MEAKRCGVRPYAVLHNTTAPDTMRRYSLINYNERTAQNHKHSSRVARVTRNTRKRLKSRAVRLTARREIRNRVINGGRNLQFFAFDQVR